MRIYLLVFGLCLIAVQSHTQNLVPNPSFEEYITCPKSGIGPSLNEHCKDWHTTIYDPNPFKNRVGGYQYLDCNPMTGYINHAPYDSILPFEGKGVVIIPSYFRNNKSINNREIAYMFSKLTGTLQKDTTYRLSYYIHANRFYGITDHYGAIFIRDTSDLVYNNFSDTVIMVVRNDFIGFRDKFYGPDMEYHKIVGCYTAKGDEKYIVFGPFLPPDEIHWHPHKGFLNSNSTTFLIDLVSVTQSTPTKENDYTIAACDGETIKLPLPDNPNTTIKDTLGREVSSVTVDWPSIYKFYYEDACFGRLGEINLTTDICISKVDTTIIICNDEPLSIGAIIGKDYRIIDEYGDEIISFTSATKGTYKFKTLHRKYGEFGVVKVEVVECENCEVCVPNILRLNSNHGNGQWQLISACSFEEYRALIYDRWGNLMFQSDSSSDSWDGKYHGRECISGVYPYVVKYKFKHPIIPQEIQYKYGSVTIIK